MKKRILLAIGVGLAAVVSGAKLDPNFLEKSQCIYYQAGKECLGNDECLCEAAKCCVSESALFPDKSRKTKLS